MSIQPLDEHSSRSITPTYATSRNKSKRKQQNPLANARKSLTQSVRDTILNSSSYSSLTKISLITDREIFSTDSYGKLKIVENKVNYKYTSNNSQPLLLEEINDFAKDFGGALHTLLYTKFINFMFYLHNEMNKRGSKAKVRMTMDASYVALEQKFDESSVEVNLKINTEDHAAALKEIDAYINVVMPLFHFLDANSKKSPKLLLVKTKDKGVYHYEWTFNINLWQFDKAFITGNVPRSGDKKFDEQYGDVINQWDRKIRYVHNNVTGNNRDQYLFTIHSKELTLLASEDEFTVDRNKLPFDWSQVDIETLLAYDNPKQGGR